MTLAQVQAVVAAVVALALSWAGLLLAVSLTLPVQTEKAARSLELAPKRCLLSGVGLFLLFLLGIRILGAPNPLVKLMAGLLLLGLGAVLSVGAAGLAQLMGDRIGEMSGAKTSFGLLVRGSLVYSAALFFPYLGWFLFAPLTTLCALGAGAAALWPKRPVPVTPLATTPPLEGQGAA
ncbi:MAG TPA: hypothetical protein VFB38_19160 [Chthonomonadaceae bacterium]|nr:hypothetical protein [Chthonomonadaceae bacterium]